MTPAVETTQVAPGHRRPRWAAQTFRVCTAPTPLSKRRRSEGYVNVESIDISSESHFVAVVFCLPSRVTFKKGKTLVEECQGITLIKLEGVVNLPLVIPSICSCKANAQVSLRGPPAVKLPMETQGSKSLKWCCWWMTESLRVELGWPPLTRTSE